MTQVPSSRDLRLNFVSVPVSIILRRFSLNFAQIFLSVRGCAEVMTRLHRLQVKVTLQGHVIYPSIRVRSIFLESFERFSLNFTQMFLSVRRCAEHMTQLPRLKVKVKGFTLEFRVCSISLKPFGRCPLNLTLMFLSVRNDAATPTQGLGYTSRSGNIPLNFVSFKSH